MTYGELLEEIKKLKLEEVRTDASEYLEFVIRQEELSGLHPLLEAYFGPPKKPAGIRPSKEDKKYTDPYGGIRNNQTLYFQVQDNIPVGAMLWPWGDKILATVKMIRLQYD